MDVLSTALDILFIPVLIFIVFTVHEFGHYLTARFFKLSIDDFSLGYGREMWGFTDRRGTRWVIRLLPLCGHVNLSSGQNGARGRLFNDAPLWQRFTVVAAGPVFNIILAFLMLFTFFVFFGQPSKPPVIGGVDPGGPAFVAGLQTGDMVVAANDRPVRRYRDLWEQTWHYPGQPVNLTVQRGEERIETVITPDHAQYIDQEGIKRSHGRIGVLIGRNFLNLKILKTVDGINVRDNPGRARDLLTASMGRPVTLGIESQDGEVYQYVSRLDPALNAHLFEPDHEHYDAFYAGPVEHNFYLPLNVAGSLIEAGKQTGDHIASVVRIPLQLFPIDREVLRPWARVANEDTFYINKIYEFTYRVALLSVLISLINLIPFPGMDGSLLLRFICEAAGRGKKQAEQQAYKYALLIALCLMYGVILGANINDFPHYVEKRLEKISRAES